MKRWKTWMTLALMILSLGLLTASDIECKDGDLEIDWPSFSHHDDCHGDCGGSYNVEFTCDPWCGVWW